jgi:hypothetical protein
VTDEAYFLLAGTGTIELHDLEHGFRSVPLAPGSYVQLASGTHDPEHDEAAVIDRAVKRAPMQLGTVRSGRHKGGAVGETALRRLCHGK